MGVREGSRESRVTTDCPVHLQPEGAFSVSDTPPIVLSLGFVLQILGTPKDIINGTSVPCNIRDARGAT